MQSEKMSLNLDVVIKSQYPLQSALFMIDFAPSPISLLLYFFLILTPDAVNLMPAAISRQISLPRREEARASINCRFISLIILPSTDT